MQNKVLDLVRRGKVLICGFPSGWMDNKTFEECSEWFIAKVKQLKKDRNCDEEQKAILFLDGHGSRNNQSIMQMYKDAKIDVVIFPSHMTHILQPFDKANAHPLKQIL